MTRSAFLCIFFLLGLGSSLSAEEPSLGEKIKDFLGQTPTPAPRHHKHRSTQKTSSPTPTPTSKSARKKKKKASPTPTPTVTPTPSASPSPTPEETATPSASATPSGRVSSLSPNEISEFEKNPEPVKRLLSDALDLTKRNLDYTYGSADPEKGGMDCSGFIYFVLQKNGFKDVPRDASEQYVWVRKAGNFRAVLSRDLDSFELDELKPGDLLFWTGTYNIERDPPVTHTMIYLGREKKDGKRVMVGSSDGRTYEGEQRFGVSVFDFKAPRLKSAGESGRQPVFVGYAKIPGLKAMSSRPKACVVDR